MIQSLLKPPKIDWHNKLSQRLEAAADQSLIDYYSAEIPLANTPLSEVTFLAMDFETTGLDPDKDGIITIGVVPFTLNRIFINQAKHWIVRPKQKLEEESVVIHGITHSDILDAPDFSMIYQEILQSMKSKIMVVHYRKIERMFFNVALKERIKEGIEFPLLDTLEIENQIQQRTTGGIWNRLKGKKPGSLRLGQSRTRYGLPAYTPHHALTDAIATAELLQAQIAHHFDDKQPISDFWL